jgi:moderate conductance mechanosensitive channel
MLQRRVVRRFAPPDQPAADSATPSLRRLLVEWAGYALRTGAWFLYFALLVNVLPHTKSEFVSLSQRLLLVRDTLLVWLFERGVNLVIVLVVTIFLMRFAAALIRTVFALIERGASDVGEEAARRRLQTLSTIFRGAAQAVILFIGLMVFLDRLAVNITPILASAGVVGIAVGFGAQSLIKDLFAGFLILLEDQYSVGDSVRIGEAVGVVEQLTLRVTRVRGALDGALTTIPNGAIVHVSNFSKGWSRAVLDVEIDAAEDLDRAMSIMLDAARQAHAEQSELLLEAPSMQGVDRLTPGALTLRMTARTAAGKQADATRDLRRRIKLAFDREKIRMPKSPYPT